MPSLPADPGVEQRPGPAQVHSAPPGESWTELTKRVSAQSAANGPFVLLVALSTTIASYGLLANSTAVVIGAMLVAPLMGPIFGIALGLAAGDARLLGRATLAELAGMALSVALAALIGLVPNHPDYGSEILSRTQPTVYDLIVAVASGLAGAFALADERVSPALPGVAIATAIVPPLATVGLCLADRRWDEAGGAFLLFLANLLAIEAAAAAYFTWVGVRRGRLHARLTLRNFVAHFGVSAVLLAGVATFLTHTLLVGIRHDRQVDAIRATLGSELGITQGARLTDLSTDRSDDTLRTFAVVMTPQEVAPEQVASIEDALRRRVTPRLSLTVRSIIARDADRAGPVYVAADEVARTEERERQASFLTRASDLLRARFAALAGVELDDVRRERRDSLGTTLNVLTAVVRTPVAFTPARVDSLERALAAALAEPVQLVVRSVLTQDVSAAGYLYRPAPADSASADSLRRPATALDSTVTRGRPSARAATDARGGARPRPRP